MEIVKKNLVNIIFGVVALLSVVALFWPIGGMFAKSQTALDGAKSDYDKATQLLNASRPMPVMPSVDPNAPPPEPLKVFPGPKVIEAGIAARDKVKAQSDALKVEAVTLNKREVVYDALPKPGDRVFDFRKAYLKVLMPTDTDLADADKLSPQDLVAHKTQVPVRKLMMATMPPTQPEIDAASKLLHDTKYEPTIYFVGGQEANRAQVEENFKRESADLPERMRQERATNNKVYMAPDAMSVSSYLTDATGKPATGAQVWYAQVALWVEQDVADSVIAANADAKDVTESVVKQLVKLDIPTDSTIYFTNDSGAAAAAAAAPPAPADRDFTRAPTGRICNSLFDVVHFTLVLNVDATRVPVILQKLEQGKLITVNQMDLQSVDAIAALDDGFVFGKVPIVQITLQCEALFLLDWTLNLMPDEVKYDQLHLPKPVPAS